MSRWCFERQTFVFILTKGWRSKRHLWLISVSASFLCLSHKNVSRLVRHSLDSSCNPSPPRTSAEANVTFHKRASTRRIIGLFEIASSPLNCFKQPRKHGHRKTPKVIPTKLKEHLKFQDKKKTHSHSEISFSVMFSLMPLSRVRMVAQPVSSVILQQIHLNTWKIYSLVSLEIVWFYEHAYNFVTKMKTFYIYKHWPTLGLV